MVGKKGSLSCILFLFPGDLSSVVFTFLECYFCGEGFREKEAKPLSEFYFSSAFQRRCFVKRFFPSRRFLRSTRRESFQRTLSLHQNNELAVSNDSSVLLCRRAKAFPTLSRWSRLLSVVLHQQHYWWPLIIQGLLHYKHRIHERDFERTATERKKHLTGNRKFILVRHPRVK